MNILEKLDARLNESHPAEGLWQKVTKELYFATADMYIAKIFIMADVGFLHKGGQYVWRIKAKIFGGSGATVYDYGPAESYENEKDAIAAAQKYYNSTIKKELRFKK